MKWVIAYVFCPAFACLILWLRQGRFLDADVQIIGTIMFGPLSPLIALFTPRSMLTSREQYEGKSLSERTDGDRKINAKYRGEK